MRLAALAVIALLLLTPAAHAATPSKGLGAAPQSPAVQKPIPDLSQMPVEDAVALLMSLISEDARKELKHDAEEMQKELKKKKALRDAEAKLKEEMKRERDALRRRRAEERLAHLKAEQEALEKRQRARLERMRQRVERERSREEARQERIRKLEEARRRRAEARAERARDRQQETAPPKPATGLGKKTPCPNPNIDCHKISKSGPQQGDSNRGMPGPPPVPGVKHVTGDNSIENTR